VLSNVYTKLGTFHTLEKPPNIGFGEVAVEAIKRVRFTPSLNSRGEPVKIRMDYKINFKPPKK